MNLLVLLVFSALQATSSGQYVKEIDDCITDGVRVVPDSIITERNVTSRVCGFLMQADKYIVVQPRILNISRDARIILYLMSSDNNLVAKTEIHEYYSRSLFRQLVFIGSGYQQFVLVVLSKTNTGNLGQFEFLYKTNCSMDLIAEDFPNIMTPNFLPTNVALTNLLNNGSLNYQSCSYRISSRTKSRFAIRLPYYQFYYTLPSIIIDNTNMYGQTSQTFNGDQPVIMSYSFQYYSQYPKPPGFNGYAESVFQTPKLQSVDGRNNSGIVQLSYMGRTYSLQHHSLSEMDGQVICINLNFGTLESIRPYENTTGLSLLSHDFQCTGQEKLLSKCNSLRPGRLSYIEYYDEKPAATVVTCKDNFNLRFVNGTNSSGFVEVEIATKWGKVCSDNMGASAGDVLCREMGFHGALDSNSYRGNTSSPGFYNYPDGEYYQVLNRAVMNNVRCGDQNRLKDCFYQTGRSYFDVRKMNDEARNRDSRVLYQDYYNSYPIVCGNGPINLTCGDTTRYSLVPHHHQGFLRYHNQLVCQSSYDMNNAAVYCRFLGYPGIRQIYQNSSFDTRGYQTINLQCSGNENSPADCRVGSTSQCTNNNAVGIICQDVALVGGNYTNQGRVEVYYKGRRGLLCDDSFNMNSGNVICKQLGFSRAYNISSNAANIYGFGNGVFLLNNLQCTGNETAIHDCSWKEFKYQNCYGNDVSGLVCVAQEERCGLSNVQETSNQTVDGYITVFGANPWQARLIPNNDNEWCSATILTSNWLLTSANCFGSASSNLYISVGSSEYNWNSANWVSTHNIQRIVQHPKYSSVTGDFNIALVKVNVPMLFSSTVQPACIASGYQSLTNQRCWTTGWNHRQTSSYRPLMGKPVEILSSSTCMSYTQFDSNRMSRYLCSLNNMEESARFNGESGGPLVCYLNGKATIVGVVSRSVFGARSTNIRLYSNVESYSEWINGVMLSY